MAPKMWWTWISLSMLVCQVVVEVTAFKNQSPATATPFNESKVGNNMPKHVYATKEVVDNTGQIHGGGGVLSITEANDFRLAQIWLVNDSDGLFEAIEVGWQVYPGMYGDNEVHFFTFYTTDGYGRVRCYNMNTSCPGFVWNRQSRLVPGQVLGPPSDLTTGVRTEINIIIVQQGVGTSRNWILFVDNIYVGYWVSSYFPRLSTGATRVQWGGEVTRTVMGSGVLVDDTHDPEQGRNMAYLSYPSYFDARGVRQYPTPDRFQDLVTPDQTCYGVSPVRHGPLGFYFYFGGTCNLGACPPQLPHS